MADGLADLPDRQGFARALEAELERSRRGEERFALLLVELDRDAPANASGTSGAGRVATALADSTRLFDVVARVDAGRFAVIVPGADSAGGAVLCERVREALRARGPDCVAVSVGVAHFPEHGGSAELLLRSAELALTTAEELGGDRCVAYSFDLEETLDAHEADDRAEPPLTLSELLDMRDPGTASHDQEVAAYAEQTALELGFSPERAVRIRLAALLHDVGKAGIPTAIVGRPGPLSSDESEEMRGHPEIGAHLLAGTELEDLAPWIEAHHEQPDGGGYPAGLAGAEIPLEASIIAVADAYAAMIADRVYRPAIGEETARAELERGAGTQFEARVVRAFLTTLGRR